ncbi:hypothetical protein ABEB36_001281 [Hypothenemus hampei]|uniref:Uncharacterized protein n=1 Tax=Hypothenemus hampei TaxID=57062 RepID=A0ABD1FE23_HYPHA
MMLKLITFLALVGCALCAPSPDPAPAPTPAPTPEAKPSSIITTYSNLPAISYEYRYAPLTYPRSYILPYYAPNYYYPHLAY